jgi:two-component system phosphate regulon sensor histidine kinase PhoR
VTFWLGPAARILGLAFASMIIGLRFGALFGWLAMAIGFAAFHLYHLFQLISIRRWLCRADLSTGTESLPTVPGALGAWGDVFAALYRLHRAERASRDRLSESLDRLSRAAGALPDGIVLLDENMRIEWSNAAAAVHLGVDHQRDRGTLIQHLVRDPDFANYVAGGGESIVLHRPTGLARTLSLALIPFSESGKLLISRDVTAIERADTVRRDFIANVSHELRTPLTVIVGFLEGMVEDAAAGNATSPELQKHQLTMMYEQAQRMQRLVDDLLTLSRLDDSQPPAREEAIDVASMLATLLEEGRALSAGRHVIMLETSVDVGLRGSRDELRSAFANLVANAVRYTPSGGQIKLRWLSRDGEAIFAVEDNGIGIATVHIPRLTERFYRVDRGRSSSGGGTGLGLAIVKHVLIRHGGRLEITSTPGSGSCFRAILPSERVLADPPRSQPALADIRE